MTGDRLALAVLENLDIWIEQIEEIAALEGGHRTPTRRLQIAMVQTRMSLERIRERGIGG